MQYFLQYSADPVKGTLALCTFLGFLFCAVLYFDSKRAGLSHIPGPFFARYTSVWGLYAAWTCIRSGDKTSFYRGLQARYGDVIRTGPRAVTVIDPAAVPVIYGVRSKLDKVSLSRFCSR